MLDVRFVPITEWPGGKAKGHLNAPFRTQYIKTLDMLEFELRKLRAREIVIEAFYSLDQIRNDGWPKANQKPSYPGIILSFKTPAGALSFPCDRYWHLEHNIHALALSLAALRAVDRYGVTKRAEQYAGWKQIAAPPSSPFPHKEAAAEFLARQAGFETRESHILITDEGLRKMAYRDAARRLHPDKIGPSEDWNNLNAALSMLEAA